MAVQIRELQTHQKCAVAFLAPQTILPEPYKCPKQARCEKGIVQNSARKICHAEK